MKLNTVDFSDDFYKGEVVDVNINGHYYGKIWPFSDKIILTSVDNAGYEVTVDYYDINNLIDDLENMELDY